MRKRTVSPNDVSPNDGAASRYDNEHGGDRQFVAALQRGLDILRCFRSGDAVLGNQDFAERTRLPKATVSRLTYTLSKLGYLVYNEASGNYRMGVPVLGLGYACLAGLKIRDTAQPFMQELADFAGDGVLVALGGRDVMSMILIACARSPGVVSLQLDVGSRISLTRSGMGWAYLYALPPDERAAVVPQIRRHVGPERWPSVETAIERAHEEIRINGFCTNFGTWNAQVNSVAVPLRLPQPDLPPLALNCGGPACILSQERLVRDIGPRLVDLAQRIASATTYLG